MNDTAIGLKRSAALCILRCGDKLLLLKRFKEPNKDNYTPVGGKLNAYESPLKAAIRETFEETGIQVDKMKFCGILTETSPTKYNWINFVYIADIDFREAPACNEGILTWVGLDELLTLPTPKTDWHIYPYILDQKPFAFSAEYDEQLNLLSMTEEIENKIIL